MNLCVKLAEDEEQLNQLLAAQDLEEGEENEFQVRLLTYKLEQQKNIKSKLKYVLFFTENTGLL